MPTKQAKPGRPRKNPIEENKKEQEKPNDLTKVLIDGFRLLNLLPQAKEDDSLFDYSEISKKLEIIENSANQQLTNDIFLKRIDDLTNSLIKISLKFLERSQINEKILLSIESYQKSIDKRLNDIESGLLYGIEELEKIPKHPIEQNKTIVDEKEKF